MISDVDFIATISVASAVMLKLNIIRKALNLGYDLHFTENPKDSFFYYPYNPLLPEGCNHYYLKSGICQIIGKVKIEGVNVLSGLVTYDIDSGFNWQGLRI